MTPVALAIVLTSGLGSDPRTAAEAEPLRDCQVVEEGASSYSIQCPGAVLRVSYRQQGAGRAFVRANISGFTIGASQPVDEEETQVHVGANTHSATRVRAADGTVLLVLGEDGAAETRVVACLSMAATDVSCRRLIAAVWPWRRGEAPPTSLPRDLAKTIAGRRISAPQGCESSGVEGSGTLVCSDGSALAWAPLPPERKGLVDGWLATFRVSGMIEEIEPCAVEGVEGTCHIVRDARGGPPAVIAAEVFVRGSLLFVSCVVSRSSPGVPPVCASVMSLSPPRANTGAAPVRNAESR